MKPAARYIASTLLTAAFLTGAVAAFNAWVDPFMQYSRPGDKPRFVTGFARHINAGLARHLDYNAVVMGSSYAMNFRNSDFNRAFGGSTVNLTMPGMYVSEGAKVVTHAARSRHLERVFFGLDFFAFVDSQRRYEFPDYLYDSTWLNDWPYLLSFDTLKRSGYARLDMGPRNYNVDPDWPWSWARAETRPSRALALADYRRLKMLHAALPPSFPPAEMQQVAVQHLGGMLAANPQTRFQLFLPPYSVLTWTLDAQQQNLEKKLAFRSFLAQFVARYPNARLHDFQAHTPLVCDLDKYTDIGHYGPDENRELVKLMAAQQFVASPASIERANSVIRDAVRTSCAGSVSVQ
ncbi:MAG: hypothetical protein V4669_12985 [Pseudomonadota bacterium]